MQKEKSVSGSDMSKFLPLKKVKRKRERKPFQGFKRMLKVIVHLPVGHLCTDGYQFQGLTPEHELELEDNVHK